MISDIANAILKRRAKVLWIFFRFCGCFELWDPDLHQPFSLSSPAPLSRQNRTFAPNNIEEGLRCRPNCYRVVANALLAA